MKLSVPPWCILLTAVWMMAAGQQLRDCHTTDPRPYIYHATKTPYELINNEDSSPIFVAGCKPVLFWMAVRHGTQYPPSKDATHMKDRLPKLRKTILQSHKERRGTLCQQDVDGLSNNGSVRIDDNSDGALTPTGREELLLLARRFRSRFADFFDAQPDFNSRDYQFRHVAGHNGGPSQASARSFSRGIFSHQPPEQVQLTEARLGDRLVQFYYNCSLWDEKVGRNEETERELNRYRQSSVFQSTLAEVTIRLGFQYNMSAEDMLLIYDMCRYQKAWNLEQTSPWCAAFTSENLKVLEYGEDLETWHKQGYGNELNYKQACPLVQDLITRIRAIKVNGTTNQQRGVFYFMEEDGLLRLMARLGLARDDKPPTSQYQEPTHERKWRTSLIGSFAANVAVVLYNCSDDYKVQVFAKENVVYLNQCQNALCTYKEFVNYLGPVADSCARDDGCNPSNSSPSTLYYPKSSGLLQLLMIAILLLVTFQK